jgi:hypothetical protein
VNTPDDLLFDVPEYKGATLASCRLAITQAQAEAVKAMREAEEACGEYMQADTLEADWDNREACRAEIEESRRIVEDDITEDDDGYDETTPDQQRMLDVLKMASRALDALDCKVCALRRQESAEVNALRSESAPSPSTQRSTGRA